MRWLLRIALDLLLASTHMLFLAAAYLWANGPCKRCGTLATPDDVSCAACGKLTRSGVLMALIVLALIFGSVVAKVKLEEWFRLRLGHSGWR